MSVTTQIARLRGGEAGGRRRLVRRLQLVARYLLLIAALAPFVFPLYWLVTGIFKPASLLTEIPPDWWPQQWTLANFEGLFHTQGTTLIGYAGNTLYISVFTMVATVVSSSLAAYGFSQVRFPGRDVLFWTVIVTLILPSWATIIPQYQLFKALGWLGTLRPLTWPTLTGDPFTIFLLRQYMLGIPTEMGEAARVDGANELQIYLRVMLPLVRPALAVAAVFAFVYSYNNFFGPLIYLTNPSNYTLSLGVYQFIQIHGTPDIAEIVAYTALVVAPLVVLFAITQRWVVQGIRLSAWK